MGDIASQTPESFYAGDTVSWEVSLSDYLATAGWAIKYYLRGPQSIDLTSSASGDNHAFAITAAASANYAAGLYSWACRAEKASDKITLGQGTLTVLANLAALTGANDLRGHVKRTLDALEATIEGKATLDQQSYSIAGRSISRMTPEELLKWRSHYKAEYANEQKAEKIARGLDSGALIRTRFN